MFTSRSAPRRLRQARSSSSSSSRWSRSSGWSGSPSTAAAPTPSVATSRSAADLAALAAANDYLLNNNSSQATDRARTVAATNGFTNGAGSTTVGVAIDTSNGVEVTVDDPVRPPELVPRRPRHGDLERLDDRDRPGRASPTARTGPARSSSRSRAFNDDGTPKYLTPTDFNETNGDVPTSQTDIAWTNYGTGNLDTQEVSDIITGASTIDETLSYGEYIGQHNNGNHNTLYSRRRHLPVRARTCRSPSSTPAATSWAGPRSTSSARRAAASKHINGYFLSSSTAPD